MINNTGTQTITTDRLILRRFTQADAQSAWQNWAGDEQVQNGYGEPVYETLEATQNLLKSYITSYEKPDTYRWGVFLKDEPDNCIGQVAYYIVDTKNEFCELEYCIGRSYQNKGYTSEAVKALIEYGFDTVAFNRIQVRCRNVNIASKRVIEKCGFTYEGCLRKHAKHLGEFQDRLYYSILKSEWDVKRDIEYYNSLPFEFNCFTDVHRLTDGEIYLVCTAKNPAIPEKNWVPAYEFIICKSGEKIGDINLRIGYTDGLYYGGQIGYDIGEKHRGNGYAGVACKLILPIMKEHKLQKVIITNEKNNTSSKRVCEKLGAKFIRVAEIPEWHNMYDEGMRYVNIFEWTI